MFNFIAKRTLAKAANVFEKELIAQCNQINGQLAEKGLDKNPMVLFNQAMANTVFVFMTIK